MVLLQKSILGGCNEHLGTGYVGHYVDIVAAQRCSGHLSQSRCSCDVFA